MFYQKELLLLQNVFKKCHVETFFIRKNSSEDVDSFKEDVFEIALSLKKSIYKFLPKKIYKYSDSFERSFCFFLLPDVDEPTIFCIGPYLHKAFSPESLLEIGEKNHLPIKNKNALLEYFSSLQVLQENSALFILISSFCETIWHTSSLIVEDFNESLSFSKTIFSNSSRGLDVDDLNLHEKNINRRYAMENEMMRAVKHGQTHFLTHFDGEFFQEYFEKRSNDTLQNIKNYMIIMNTLLRKGAEEGGVHPIYLDQISSSFAHKLETLPSPNNASALMKEMFFSYCKLVQKHSLQHYTRVVQKTILTIDADLSADLSPKLLADKQGVTLGYLSSVFKKETNKTITQYVCQRRMEYAKYLLKTTNLQIQTIALHCGIIDLQYFSKQFKKYYGISPLAYRRNPKSNN